MKLKSRLALPPMAGQHQEDGARAARRQTDDLTTVGQAQSDLQDRPEHDAHEAGQGEQQDDAEAAVACRRDAEEHAHHDGEGTQRIHDRVLGHEAEVHAHADERADHGRNHGQAEQHVGIAQDLVGL
jgi:hypothetical protein